MVIERTATRTKFLGTSSRQRHRLGGAEGDVICFDATIEQPCLQFSMFDSYGDGIFAPGGYTLYQDGTEIASGGDYGYGETVNFDCAPGRHATMRSSLTNRITVPLSKPKAMRVCFHAACQRHVRIQYVRIWLRHQALDLRLLQHGQLRQHERGLDLFDDEEGGCGEANLRCCWKAVRPFGSEWVWVRLITHHLLIFNLSGRTMTKARTWVLNGPQRITMIPIGIPEMRNWDTVMEMKGHGIIR